MADNSHKIAVKTALAEKYERLSRIAGSTPKRKTYSLRALRYRRQMQQMQHPAKG